MRLGIFGGVLFMLFVASAPAADALVVFSVTGPVETEEQRQSLIDWMIKELESNPCIRQAEALGKDLTYYPTVKINVETKEMTLQVGVKECN